MVGGVGTAIEYAVKMHEFPQDALADRLAARGELSVDRMDELAATIGGRHRGRDRRLGSIGRSGGGGRRPRREFEHDGPGAASDGTAGACADRRRSSARGRALRGSGPGGRGGSGPPRGSQSPHVRRAAAGPTFDCIEFNDRFRFGDVMGEIAFLAMDLERLGGPAWRGFLNAYLEESGDYEAVLLLDFYRAYRAWVRAKVMSFEDADHPERADEARALFALAARFGAPHRDARLVGYDRRDGDGQGTVARHAAARLGAIVVRTDAVRKRLAGRPLRERVAAAFGEGLTRRRCPAHVRRGSRLADELLRARWPVIVDGTFSHAEKRPEARALADRHRAPFGALWCDRRTRCSCRGSGTARRAARGLRWARGSAGAAPRPLRVAGGRAGRDPLSTPRAMSALSRAGGP